MSPEIYGLIKLSTGAIYITLALIAPFLLDGTYNGSVSANIFVLKVFVMLFGLPVIWKIALSPKKRTFTLRSAGVLYVASSAGVLVPYMSLAILSAITGFFLIIPGFIEVANYLSTED